ncbi:hypothetical protein IX51_08840 [uncultured archaeon]|nr:hypothetical protein IX51_08840 [uncultured archaeon]
MGYSEDSAKQEKRSIDRRLILFFAVNISVTALLFLVLFGISSTFTAGTKKIILSSGIITSNFIYLGVLALLFGLRHSVDADHIAAIDTSTRKLINEGKRSEFAGFFFSMGHSTVVFALSVLLMTSTRYVTSHLPSLETLGSVIGPLVSSTFLFIMAAINLSILFGLRAIFHRALKDDDAGRLSIDDLIGRMGILNRVLKGLFSSVKSQAYLYPIGLLFGLGFDTASEVVVLSISATLAGLFVHVPLYVLLIFPAFFTLGMTLIDTTDGYMMFRAYRWAFSDPVKKLWYNMVLTAASVAFAVLAGGFEIISTVTGYFGLNGFPWAFFESVSNTYWYVLGILIISVFVVIGLLSYMRYRKYLVSRTTS